MTRCAKVPKDADLKTLIAETGDASGFTDQPIAREVVDDPVALLLPDVEAPGLLLALRHDGASGAREHHHLVDPAQIPFG